MACVAGIFTFYLYYGIAQERVYKENTDGSRFSSVAFMLLAQCAMNAAFAGIGGAVYEALFSTASSSEKKKKDLSEPAADSAPGYLRALCGARLTGHTWMCFISLKRLRGSPEPIRYATMNWASTAGLASTSSSRRRLRCQPP